MSSISSIGAAGISNLLWPSDSTNGSSSSSSAANGPSDSVQISGPGQLLSELQQLQATDPAKFKQVVGQIAQQLDAAAQQQGSNGLGQFLTNLANKFQNVADGGDPSQLQPGKQVHGHHGHHHHQTYDSNGTTTPSSTSPNDPNDPLNQLFTTIASEVSQALNNVST